MADEIVDACCIINLYAASNDFCSFLQAIGASFRVPQVVVEESLYVHTLDKEDEHNLVNEEIHLSAALEAGVLQICDLTTTEENGLFVQFASELDDGEAACLAIAKARGWTVATDDRKARRLANESGVRVVSTPELIKRWADAEQATDPEIGSVVQRIRDFARFIPRRGSVLFEWWMERLEE